MAAPLNRFDGRAVRSASASFGSVAAAGSDADVFQDDKRLVAVWGHARFIDADLAALAQRHGVAHALAQGYERRGPNVLTALSGAFALAVLDSCSGQAVLAIDRMGARPLCYCVVAGTLVFRST
ncbi:MAG: asparagine synthase, partial [Alphaproteobacteria bacterium]|nr:asparagine synthase [Alphaproteobacteria bacterium]